MNLEMLTPQQAVEKQQRGAQLIDIRSSAEFAAKHIAGAQSLPIERLERVMLPESERIFYCLSGMRTQQQAVRLAQLCGGRAFVLQGGLNAWERAGLPVTKHARAMPDIMRQVQMIAGSLVLVSVGLGAGVSSWFYLLAAFVGAGLLLAGLTGFCGMAKLLVRMPWNRV